MSEVSTDTKVRSSGETMNGTTAAVARLRAWAGHGGGGARKGRLARGLALVLLAALFVPVLMMATSSPASADDKKERDNYSLYQLASNASSYFSEKNSPSNDKGMHDNWKSVVGSPASGGSMLGYADPDFSLGNIVAGSSPRSRGPPRPSRTRPWQRKTTRATQSTRACSTTRTSGRRTLTSAWTRCPRASADRS